MAGSVRWWLVAAVALAAAPVATQSEPGSTSPPTLEAILGAPFPSELLAAPTGGAFAWVQNARGVRNLWVAAPPDYRGRQLTSYTEDDGQALGGIEWTLDAKTIVFVRGSGANAKGEPPNPTSDPDGVEQAVWRVALDGGAPVRIGKGSGAAVSPRGDGVAYRSGGKIWWAPLPTYSKSDAGSGIASSTASSTESGTASGTRSGVESRDESDSETAAEPKVLVEVRRGASSLRWSPDGARLAFVSDRGDHALVGVFDVAAKSVRWMAPSVDRDSEPAWSADGARLAFVRESADLDFVYFHPRRTAHPWSIQVADVSTGEARAAFTAEGGRGSAFQSMDAANQVLWGADDRIVFPWERDGWLHLYSVPAAGGAPALLTPGQFEIENVLVTPDGRDAIYNSNQGDPERRHLWRVPVGGGTPVQITRGEEIVWMPAVPKGGDEPALAFFRAGPRRPAEAVIRVGDGAERALAPESMPADYPAAQLVDPAPVEMVAADGVRVRGQLFLPPSGAPQISDSRVPARRPAVIFLHGGPPRQMLLGWHPMSYYNNAYGMNQYLASRGFVVLALNFRCGIGYGLEFREALGQGAEGASEFQDVLTAAEFLRRRPDVDAARIGLWGGSYGGYLTAHALARASNLFRAGVDIHGVHDWNEGIRLFFPDYEPLERPAEARRAFESSPLHFLDGWRSPVLVIHGDDDRNVDFEQTVRLVQELRKRKVEVEQLVLPDEVHSFLTWRSWLAVYRATAEFLERRLTN